MTEEFALEMRMQTFEAKRLVARLENAADYLEMCARLKTLDMAWDHPVIERKFTAMPVMRQAAEYLKIGTLPE